jgi:hypothetical protein
VSSVHPRHAERIRKMKQRLAVRAWEFRQRNSSKGVWDRLRLVLALSERAFAIDDALARSLEARGHHPHPVGAELEPARQYFVLDAGDVGLVEGAREIPVRLDMELLAHERVALVLFPGVSSPQAR